MGSLKLWSIIIGGSRRIDFLSLYFLNSWLMDRIRFISKMGVGSGSVILWEIKWHLSGLNWYFHFKLCRSQIPRSSVSSSLVVAKRRMSSQYKRAAIWSVSNLRPSLDFSNSWTRSLMKTPYRSVHSVHYQLGFFPLFEFPCYLVVVGLNPI